VPQLLYKLHAGCPANSRRDSGTSGRNVQPFATLEEAIQMAQDCFVQLTGDDRYFAKEDIWNENKPD